MGRRALVVCADDYGLSEAISLGILDLVALGRVSAISCLSVAPEWPRLGRMLRERAGDREVGLHIALTELVPVGPMPRLAPRARLPSLPRLITAAFAGALDHAEIAAEVGRQLEAFASVLGRPPDFLDGHQHVHTLPVIREVVIELLAAHGLSGRAWVRSTCEPTRRIAARRVAVVKAAGLALVGRALRRRLDAAGVARNDSFRGVTDLRSAARVPALFEAFLQGEGSRPLLMCHPARADNAVSDGFAAQRAAELAYLASERFARALEAEGLRVGAW